MKKLDIKREVLPFDIQAEFKLKVHSVACFTCLFHFWLMWNNVNFAWSFKSSSWVLYLGKGRNSFFLPTSNGNTVVMVVVIMEIHYMLVMVIRDNNEQDGNLSTLTAQASFQMIRFLKWFHMCNERGTPCRLWSRPHCGVVRPLYLCRCHPVIRKW